VNTPQRICVDGNEAARVALSSPATGCLDCFVGRESSIEGGPGQGVPRLNDAFSFSLPGVTAFCKGVPLSEMPTTRESERHT
jgi:hypothetical protein